MEPVTFGIVSLGCPKNLVDSEKIAAKLLQAGFVLCEDETAADVVVVNTCCFIAPAREETFSVIREFAGLKRRKKLRALIVAGCMAVQKGETLLEQFEEIDAVLAFSAYPRIAQTLRRVLEEGGRFVEGARDYELGAELGRLILSGPHSAYLRIAEGCPNACTFCTIPAIRGPLRSKPPEAVLEEAGELAAFGIRELVLIAQDTTSYGDDLGGDANLAGLIGALAGAEDIGWIRLMYANPARVTDELIDAIAGTPSVVKYLDMPVQHISGPVLKKMGRHHTEKSTRALVRRLHERIPGLALRTSLMVGFPGETREDFDKLLDFVREGHFQRLGAFTYSKEKGTPASRMRKAVPPEAAARRYEELMLAQQDVAFTFAAGLVGKHVDVLVESECEGGAFAFEGRTYMDAPEVDCKALIRSRAVRPGRIMSMEVVDTQGYDIVV